MLVLRTTIDFFVFKKISQNWNWKYITDVWKEKTFQVYFILRNRKDKIGISSIFFPVDKMQLLDNEDKTQETIPLLSQCAEGKT